MISLMFESKKPVTHAKPGRALPENVDVLPDGIKASALRFNGKRRTARLNLARGLQSPTAQVKMHCSIAKAFLPEWLIFVAKEPSEGTFLRTRQGTTDISDGKISEIPIQLDRSVKERATRAMRFDISEDK